MKPPGNEAPISEVLDDIEAPGEAPKHYPALLIALADPEKRAKLRRICESLKNHNQLENVYYGYGESSVPFDIVSEYIGVLT